MIAKRTGSSHNAFMVIPEDADDLLALRRVIRQGDIVVADTTRVVKQVQEFARPDRGERVKVRVSIRVEQSQLDAAVDRLRISGSITESNNELISRGSHYSVSIQLGDVLVIDKGIGWQDFEVRLLNKSGTGYGFLLVAIDTHEAAVARIFGTHVGVIPNIYSGQSGKRYQARNNPNLETFFADIAKTISSVIRENDGVLIFGPGETRKRFFNFLVDRVQEIPKDKVKVVEGVDVAGEDGIFVFLRSRAMKETMSTSKLASVSSMLDHVMVMVNRGEAKFAMGMKDVSNAAIMKAVESVVFSDSIFKTADEDEVVSMLNAVESHGGTTFAVDSSTDMGLRVSSLGGIVAILRYPIH